MNLAKLRIERPTKFIFFCGGTIRSGNSNGANSLRDYLYRVRSCSKRLHGEIVLAEAANELYRDTRYGDLISFEEDIARIAAVVLVIAESPGSLAELGAFASNETIRRALRVILQTSNWNKESFIRYGPVERIRNDNSEHIGVYPWRTNAAGNLIVRSARPHHSEIIKFLNQHLDATSKTEIFPAGDDLQMFFVTYWVIYLSYAISSATLYDLIRMLIPAATNNDIRNKVFCMQLAGWVAVERYSGKDYFYCCQDRDAFHYAYHDHVTARDSNRRKLAISTAIRQKERTPRHVTSVAAAKRVPE